MTKYSGSKWLRRGNAKNVLEELGVSPDQSDRAHDLIYADAKQLGMLTEINGSEFLDTTPGHSPQIEPDNLPITLPSEGTDNPTVEAATNVRALGSGGGSRRVFITHGKQHKVEQIKTLLAFGDLEPVVSVENSTIAKPVPDR